MKILIHVGKKVEDAEFDPIQTVLTPDLYILIYTLKGRKFLDKISINTTDDFSLFHLTKIHHLMYGLLRYDNRTFDAQVGSYLTKDMGRMRGFDNFLMRHFPFDGHFNPFFEDFHGQQDVNYLIIDYTGFNKTRELLSLPTLTFKEYIQLLLKYKDDNPTNIFLSDETSLFNVVSSDFNIENLITTKGLDIYLEEQTKDRKQDPDSFEPPPF